MELSVSAETSESPLPARKRRRLPALPRSKRKPKYVDAGPVSSEDDADDGGSHSLLL